MGKQKKIQAAEWLDELEKIYIYTYQDVYRHIKLLISNDEKAKELLILTYLDAYSCRDELQGKKEYLEWMKNRSDSIAVDKMGVDQDTVDESYAEEKMQEEKSPEKRHSNLDEVSVFLEISDRLNVDDNQDSAEGSRKVLFVAQNIFSFGLFIAAVAILVFGAGKIREQLEILKEPFETTIASGTEEESEEEKAENRIKVKNKVVYLSDVGKVLYSLPLEETDLSSEEPLNPEIQKQTGWTYYLPCPEREDSQLSEVSPSLTHTLYRMQGDGKEIEIIEREVDDYTFWNDDIYVSKLDRIQRVDMSQKFERIKPGIDIAAENGEFYLNDLLGRTLETDSDGSIRYGDRIFEMSSNRIEGVKHAVFQKGSATYSLKNIEDGAAKGIYRKVNGHEELYLEEDKTIDSFCIAGDWIYYSAYVRKSGSGANYSQIYKKSLTSDEGPALVRDDFKGRMAEMFYCEENKQIYCDYIPRNWKNNHGVIGVLTLNGQLSYLDDEDLRTVRETTGNDLLEFVMMKDGQVYCFWEDTYWKKGEIAVVIWRDVLVIPDSNRIPVE